MDDMVKSISRLLGLIIELVCWNGKFAIKDTVGEHVRTPAAVRLLFWFTSICPCSMYKTSRNAREEGISMSL